MNEKTEPAIPPVKVGCKDGVYFAEWLNFRGIGITLQEALDAMMEQMKIEDPITEVKANPGDRKK